MWMLRPDGEVVADVADIKIQKCLPNKAELAWSEAVAQPGEEVDLQLTSAPNSLCSLGIYLVVTFGKRTMLVLSRLHIYSYPPWL